jgi:hypothetical protein
MILLYGQCLPITKVPVAGMNARGRGTMAHVTLFMTLAARVESATKPYFDLSQIHCRPVRVSGGASSMVGRIS